MRESPDSKKAKTYRLPLGDRVARWWCLKREVLSFVLVGVFAVAGLGALLAGQPGIAGTFGLLGLTYLLFAYAPWFWGD